MRLAPSIKPRKWQTEALAIWNKDMRGIVEVVTGGGKTVFSYFCIQRFLERFPDGCIFIIVPTLALLDQWFLDIVDSTNLDEQDVICFSGRSELKPKRVNIVVLNTARTLMMNINTSAHSMLIVDECHRAGSPINSASLDGNYDATLGLSATPVREYDEGLDKYIIPALGDIIYKYNYNAARLDDVIVDFRLVNIDISLSDNDAKSIPLVSEKLSASTNNDQLYRTDNSRKNTSTKKILVAAAHATRVSWAVKLCSLHEQERIVVFHEQIPSIIRIADLLNRIGYTAVSYHSKMSVPHRRDNLRLFRRGEVRCLVTCRALDEGANVPEANVAVVARSTKSTRQRIQRLGRVLRPAPGKHYALIYTLYTTEKEKHYLEHEEDGLEGVARIAWKQGRVK